MTTGVPDFPVTLPAKTVVGRLASTAGPAEAVPIAALSAALTDPLTVTTLHVGPQTGWTAFEKAAFVDTAENFFGATNLPLLGLTQTNYFQFLGHDDSNTVPNIVSTYAVLTDNHAAGTRASSVGFEGDIFHTGAGTTTGEAGVIGFAQIDAGVVGDQLGVQGQAKITGGSVTRSAAVYGISVMTGGAAVNTYAGLFAGPAHSGGTVTNNYGVYIGYVGTGGSSTNYQFYTETATNPVVIDRQGNVGILKAVPTVALDVVGQMNITSSISIASGGQLVGAAGSSAAPTAANSAINLNSAGTAANYAGIFFNGSTTYNTFFGRVPTALSGVNDGVGFVAGGVLTALYTNTGLTLTGTFGCNGATTQAASTGYGTPTNGAKQASFDATAITLPNLAKATAQLIIDLKAIGFLAA